MQKTHDLTVANIILQQLGGRRFIAMTGASMIVGSEQEKFLMFKVGSGAKQGINKVKITLTPADVYKMEFYKIRGVNAKLVAVHEIVYCEQLQTLFTEETGFYTKM